MTLRGIALNDADAITRLLAGDTKLALQTATLPIPYSIESARVFLQNADPQQVFAVIVDKDVIGAAGFHGAAESIEIGYWIGRKHWGQGHATAAVGLLIKQAVGRGLRRLAAEVFPDNPASMRVLEKNGFVRARVVQRHLPQRGGLRDLVRFECLLTPP